MTTEPRGELVAQLRDLLAHLYDYGYYEKHPLLTRLPGKNTSPRERMRALRRLILEGIETLRTTQQVRPLVPSARPYQVLHMHYVMGLMVKEIATELDLSTRQVYRHLRKAEEDLAGLLEQELSPVGRSEEKRNDNGSRADLVLQEAQRLEPGSDSLPIESLLSGAIASVMRLAEEHEVTLGYERPAPEMAVFANRQLLRQVLVGALSYAIQNAPPGASLVLSAAQDEREVRFELASAAGPATAAGGELPREVRELAESLGGRCLTARQEDGRLLHTIALRSQTRKHVLVIDDNQGILELMRRYLTGTDYYMTGVADGAAGMRVIAEERPDVIILDVLLAHQDGWEILQNLQSHSATQNIPVLICSVFNDPALARSLGAAAFLTKPVHRVRLLETLAALVAADIPHAKSGAGL